MTVFWATLIELNFLPLQRSQKYLCTHLMSVCVCYVDGNLFAEHNYGKFLQLVIKCTELVTTAGFFSVLSDPDLFREVKTFSGETEVFTNDCVIKKLCYLQ